MAFRNRQKVLIICILIIVGFLAFMPLISQFSTYDTTLEKPIFLCHIAPGDSFSMSYIHSVNKSKVTDKFVITSDYDVMLKSTEFFSYGAGIPEPTPNSSEKIIVYDDRIEIINIDRILNPYSFFVGVTADHTLTIDNNTVKFADGYIVPGTPIHLKDHVAPKTSVTISIEKVSLLAFLISL